MLKKAMQNARERELIKRHEKDGLFHRNDKHVVRDDVADVVFEKYMDMSRTLNVKQLMLPEFHEIEHVADGRVVEQIITLGEFVSIDTDTNGKKYDVPFSIAVSLFYTRIGTIHPYYGITSRQDDSAYLTRFLSIPDYQIEQLTLRIDEFMFLYKLGKE